MQTPPFTAEYTKMNRNSTLKDMDMDMDLV